VLLEAAGRLKPKGKTRSGKAKRVNLSRRMEACTVANAKIFAKIKTSLDPGLLRAGLMEPARRGERPGLYEVLPRVPSRRVKNCLRLAQRRLHGTADRCCA
jgi:hypothetical protein